MSSSQKVSLSLLFYPSAMQCTEPVGARVAECSEYVAAVDRHGAPKHQDVVSSDKEGLSTLAPRFPNSWNQESFVARVIAPSPETPLSEPAATWSARPGSSLC
ncbi:hypothetical protein BDP55DRAFT_626430 [Colletotrichum godetiae]|uniref:Uncharacterized protein n=1 Tax=Colletotrichum godetiae TaxID=1209918 RepID=A0AAJ0AZN2_9PEZI|nr:uncharacterized protein BDP55DRAFT_626430 [Colletotrichum godetiae]KAK1699728.1 hypothetical protein BDP55DRAFT_626430 [Colletotrichum godetiae]